MAKKHRSEVPPSEEKTPVAPTHSGKSIMAGLTALSLLVAETMPAVEAIVEQTEARKTGPNIKSARILPALSARTQQVVNHNLVLEFGEDAEIFISVPFDKNKEGKFDLQPEIRTAGQDAFIRYHTMEYLASAWYGKPATEQGTKGGVYLMQNLPMSARVVAKFRAWLNALNEEKIEALKKEGVIYSRKVLERVTKVVDGQNLITTEETVQNLFCVPICILGENLHLYSWCPDEKGIVQFNAEDPQSWALSDKPNWVNITVGRSTRQQARYIRGGPNPKNGVAVSILKNMVKKAMEHTVKVGEKEITLAEYTKTLRGQHSGNADPRNFTRQERQAPAIRRGQVDAQAPDARQFTSRPARAAFATDDTTVSEGTPVTVDGAGDETF